MPKRGKSPNTRSGGQPAEMKFRQIVADPAGNREQRRAAQQIARRSKRKAGGTDA